MPANSARKSKNHELMQNVLIELTPHTAFVPVLEQIAQGDIGYDFKGLDKITSSINKAGTNFYPAPEKEGVFMLFLDQMGGSDFVKMGLTLTGEKSSGVPLMKMFIIGINDTPTLIGGYDTGQPDLSEEFITSYRLS